MGYRTYIGRLSKKDAENLKEAGYDDIAVQEWEDEPAVPPGPYDLAECIYELGKYVDLEAEQFRLFNDDELENYYNEEYEFYGITKVGFAEIINGYTKQVQEYYSKLQAGYGIVGVDQTEIENHLRSMSTEWLNNPIDLRDDTETITTSWKYEYAIFELVRLYKQFDWENDIAVIYGY